jgi:hypothetical protein
LESVSGSHEWTMTTTYFPNGLVQTSTALTPYEMDGIFQLLTTQMLGIAANVSFDAQLTAGSNIIVGPLVVLNIFAGFYVVGDGIPLGTVITGMIGQGTSLLIELSNAVTISAQETVQIYDPLSNTKVRQVWQTQGAPAFTITDDVVFVRCTETETDYNTIRDEQTSGNTDGTGTRTRTYSRMWNIFFRARGPNSFDQIRLIKSMLLEDFPHDTLASINLYLVLVSSTPVRAPVLFEGQWWEQVDYNADFLEEVTETFTISTISSVQVIGFDEDGQIFDVKPELK